jgi:hypothetical protein
MRKALRKRLELSFKPAPREMGPGVDLAWKPLFWVPVVCPSKEGIRCMPGLEGAALTCRAFKFGACLLGERTSRSASDETELGRPLRRPSESRDLLKAAMAEATDGLRFKGEINPSSLCRRTGPADEVAFMKSDTNSGGSRSSSPSLRSFLREVLELLRDRLVGVKRDTIRENRLEGVVSVMAAWALGVVVAEGERTGKQEPTSAQFSAHPTIVRA